ncbi:hypothetical protein Tco_1337848 [Tanacetum coccineum]
MGDEPFSTIPATETDEIIKSSVENLVPIPREFEGISDDTSDVPNCDNNRVNVEIDFVESLINRDTSIVHVSKIGPIFEEFASELAHIALIPPGIVEADFNPNDDTSSDDDSYEDIEYIDATPPNSELVSLEEVEDIEPDQDGLISIDNSNNTLLELPEFESFHFDPSFPRPPPEPPDVEILKPENNNFDVLNNDESFDPREGENIVVSNVEEDDSFTFTIRTFLPFLTYPKDSPLSCSTGSEDLIFDPGIITFHFLKPVAFSMEVSKCTDKSEIARKQSRTGKHGHGNQKSTKRSQRIKAEARKVKPHYKWRQERVTIHFLPQLYHTVKSRGFLQLRVKMENSSDREQDGKDKSVKSSSLIGSLMPRILKEAQEKRGFVIIALTKEAHMSLSRIAKLAIRVSSFVIQGLLLTLK